MAVMDWELDELDDEGPFASKGEAKEIPYGERSFPSTIRAALVQL